MSDLRETQDYLAEVIADRDRLRAALTDLLNDLTDRWDDEHMMPGMLDCVNQARAALAGGAGATVHAQHDETGRLWSGPRAAIPKGYSEVGGAVPASERRDDAEAMCRLLASIWFYGNWRWETPNERDLQAILERRGWWPITEDALIAKARATDQPTASQCAHPIVNKTRERGEWCAVCGADMKSSGVRNE